MKKSLGIFMALAIAASSTTAFAADNGVNVVVNGSKLTFDQNPIIEDGRVLVPFRKILEELDCEVGYSEADGQKTITASKGTKYVYTNIGENKMYVNGEEVQLDVPAQIKNSRTLVPIRAISESFDASVNWDADTRTVTINSKQGQYNIKTGKLSKVLKDSSGHELIKISYEYPVIENSGNSAFVEKINADYKKSAEDYAAEIENNYLKDAEEFYASVGGDTALLPFEAKVTYDVDANRKDILSITSFESIYLGGAHPSSSKVSKVYDMKNGKELALTDILNLSQEEIDKLVTDKFTDYIVKELSGGDQSYIEDLKKSLEQEKKNVCYYVTDDGVVLYFQVYAIAPYAAGYPTTEISYKGNENMFKIDLSEAALSKLAIEAEGNPTTGYTWKVTKTDDSLINVASDYKEDAHKEGMVGVGGTYTFTATAKDRAKSGNCTLELSYLKDWEGESSTEKVLTYKLYVADGKITVLEVK